VYRQRAAGIKLADRIERASSLATKAADEPVVSEDLADVRDVVSWVAERPQNSIH